MNDTIRELSIRITKEVMRTLSGYGVKIVLPHLLHGLEDKPWRVKITNIWALGNMAYCSPKQLSSCLPQIVPKLSVALAETDPRIRQSANEALELIGSTIKNPEISEVARVLINALSNPFDENIRGLEVLLKTRFVHYVDHPALSLIVPIIDYGLRSRDTEQRQRACQVVGSITNVIKEPNDLIPYMDILVGGLRVALCDTLQEVRNLAAKALGSVASKIGRANAERFFKFLYEIMESEASTSIERAGAAQGLTEVMYGLGQNYFEGHLAQIFEKAHSKLAHVRESYIGIFVYAPGILGDRFEQ